MPCLLVVIALAMPRLVAVLLWFFTTWFTGIFASLVWPILGFLVAPTTLLWYVAVQHWYGGVWSTWPVVGLVIAVLIDMSPASGRRSRASRD